MTNIIDAHETIEQIVSEIKIYFANNGHLWTKAVIGISGGKDSTIAAALLVRALGPERVIAVMMPCGGQSDIADSYRVCDVLNIPEQNRFEIDIGESVQALYRQFGDSKRIHTPAILTNTPARLRMTTLYTVAALVGGRVINTGNASELYVGYTTKYGDLAGDYAILKNFYVRDVLAIGDALSELPYDLVHKTPGDGMCGLSDEDNMGFTYEQVDALVLDNRVPEYETYLAIMERHKRNLHKRDIFIPGPQRHPLEQISPFDF